MPTGVSTGTRSCTLTDLLLGRSDESRVEVEGSVPYLFPNCSLSVPELFPNCSLTVPYPYVYRPQVAVEGSVPYMFPNCSLSVPQLFPTLMCIVPRLR
jgi:hypothetical protein